jgi:LAO/AO transport system kinase
VAPILNSVRRGRLAPQQYIDGILRADRTLLARAITLVESDLPADADLSAAVLDAIMPHSGNARRVGISGTPGAGKSTFIDCLGMHLIRDRAESVAVLSVDPSSPFSGGSILGDKTRMDKLSVEDKAFIRPSPARGRLGGVARRTRETMLLCEAAGYQNIIVETVGVGQSETTVRAMTDFFLLLAISGGGDELQGIKRGILEMIDALAINKADSGNEARAERARVEYKSALHLFPATPDGWSPPVVAISALTGKGIPELWEIVLKHRAQLDANGYLAERRRQQARSWMHELIFEGLEDLFRLDPTVASLLPALELAVQNGSVAPSVAARRILSIFRSK